MVAIGGYNAEMVTPWYTLAASAAARQNFARNIREFIVRNDLDGVGMYVTGLINEYRHIERCFSFTIRY